VSLFLVTAAGMVPGNARAGPATPSEGQPQVLQNAESRQERLQKAWQRTVDRAFAQHQKIVQWHKRVSALKAQQVKKTAASTANASRTKRVFSAAAVSSMSE